MRQEKTFSSSSNLRCGKTIQTAHVSTNLGIYGMHACDSNRFRRLEAHRNTLNECVSWPRLNFSLAFYFACASEERMRNHRVRKTPRGNSLQLISISARDLDAPAQRGVKAIGVKFSQSTHARRTQEGRGNRKQGAEWSTRLNHGCGGCVTSWKCGILCSTSCKNEDVAAAANLSSDVN